MLRLLHYAAVSLISCLPAKFARKCFFQFSQQQHPQDNAKEEKQLLIDVSVIFRNDAKTGIQRVVRALLRQLLLAPPAGWRIRPVFAGRTHGYR